MRSKSNRSQHARHLAFILGKQKSASPYYELRYLEPEGIAKVTAVLKDFDAAEKYFGDNYISLAYAPGDHYYVFEFVDPAKEAMVRTYLGDGKGYGSLVKIKYPDEND